MKKLFEGIGEMIVYLIVFLCIIVLHMANWHLIRKGRKRLEEYI